MDVRHHYCDLQLLQVVVSSLFYGFVLTYDYTGNNLRVIRPTEIFENHSYFCKAVWCVSNLRTICCKNKFC